MLENIKLNLNSSVSESAISKHVKSSVGSVEDERKKKIAKDFEGVLINKVMDEMQNTIPDSGLLEDETSKQTQSLFYMFLSQDVAAKGGFGFWKQIYEQMNTTQEQISPPKTMDTTI
jgi:Rod binding domain-containing protein